MKTVISKAALILAVGHIALGAVAAPLDPDCTPEKAAKSAATKGAIGVGGRCDAKEAAKDSAKREAGIEKKGPLEKQQHKNDTLAEKAKDSVKGK